MGKPKPPPPPDYEAVAEKQGEANVEAIRESAKINAIDKINPYGAVTWIKDGEGLPIAQHQTHSDEYQPVFLGQLKASQILTERAESALNQIPDVTFNADNLPIAASSIDLTTLPDCVLPVLDRLPKLQYKTYEEARDDYVKQSLVLIGDQMKYEIDALRQSLHDRGIPLDSAIASRELTRLYLNHDQTKAGIRRDAIVVADQLSMTDYQKQLSARENDLNEQLKINQAILATRAELVNEQTTSGNFNNKNRQDQMAEQMLVHNRPFEEALTYLTGQPARHLPQFSQQPQYQIQPPDYMRAAENKYAAEMQQYQVKQQQFSSMMSGVLGLGSLFMPGF